MHTRHILSAILVGTITLALAACSGTATSDSESASADTLSKGGGKPGPGPDPGCGGGGTGGGGTGAACGAPGACGPALGMPNYLCADGKTVGGPTGKCLDLGGKCGWEIVDCPCDCGPAPAMAKSCPDGSTYGPICSPDKGTGCGWVFPDCKPLPPPPPPAGKCDAPGACGPALGMPNYLCSDGKTKAGPTGRCLDQGGSCGWEVVKCP